MISAQLAGPARSPARPGDPQLPDAAALPEGLAEGAVARSPSKSVWSWAVSTEPVQRCATVPSPLTATQYGKAVSPNAVATLSSLSTSTGGVQPSEASQASGG